MENISIDILRLIFKRLHVVDAVRFASTCSRFRTRLRRDPYITVWEDCWMRTSRGVPTVRNTDLAEDKLVAAAAIGDISLVKLFIRYASHKIWALYAASRWDRQEVVTYLREVPHTGTQAMIQHAIDYGFAVRNNLSCDMPVHVIISQGCRFGDLEAVARCEFHYYTNGFRTAAKHGHTNILEWGASHSLTYILESLEAAAVAGQLHVFEWAFEKFGVTAIMAHIREIYKNAIDHVQIPVLEYLATRIEPARALSFTDRTNICMRAIDRRQVALFDWLATSGALVRKSRLARNIIRRMHQYDDAGMRRSSDHEAMFAVLRRYHR